MDLGNGVGAGKSVYGPGERSIGAREGWHAWARAMMYVNVSGGFHAR